MRVPLEMWPHEKTREFIKERVLLHDAAKLVLDESLPACTPEERWAKPTTWAVMKPGRKSALSVHESLANARASQTAGTSIVERPGSSRRCEGYCPVGKAGRCSQWNADSTNPANAKEAVA